MRCPLALRGARIVDIEARAVTAPTTVIAADGRVALTEPGAIPGDAIVMDVDGAWLMPGLVDSHVHAHAGWVRRHCLLNGVTSLCDPAAVPRQWDDDPETTQDEPHVTRAGPPLDFPPGTWPHAVFVTNEADVRDEVRRQAADGFAFVKLYSGLPSHLIRAGIDEAHALGLRAIGDLIATSWTEAATAGIDMLCHVPQHPDLLPPSARADFRRELRKGRVHPLVRWAELVDFDSDELKLLIEALLARSVAVVPTLAAVEAALRAPSEAYRATMQHAVERLPAELQGIHRAPDTTKAPPDHEARVEHAWERILQLIGRLHAAGVRLLAGTDAPRPWVIPGASLHRELELLVEAGVPADDVLRLATTDSARALRIEGVSGRIAEGEAADFVLLDRNPLKSLAAFKHIRMVVLRGRVVT